MPTAEELAARRRRKEELKAKFFNPPLSAHRYRAEHIIGQGAYGIVCSAVDTVTGEKVAVKRILKCLETYPLATRILRELKFLRMLSKHENIIQVRDVLLPGDFDKFNDTFVVFELMPTDLHRVLRSSSVLRPDHVKYFMWQMLRGIHFMHTARVFHRDIKPNNILINAKCELRICDLGLARAAFANGPDTRFWTDYVTTRWYRAPELVMEDSTKYSTAIDIWSAGCIFAEMLCHGKVLFPGRTSTQQIELITDVLGPPPPEAIDKLHNLNAKRTLLKFQNAKNKPCRPLSQLFAHVDKDALDVLSRMLEFDPDKRMSALDALNHAYFCEYRHLGLGAEATPLPAEEFAFESQRMDMRTEFLKEILHYHPEFDVSSLREQSASDAFMRDSAVDTFGKQMESIHSGGGIGLQSQTLQERVLGSITDGNGFQSGAFAPNRQTVTMSEREMGQFTRR